MRCFIAIDLDTSVKDNIREFIELNRLSQIFNNAKWVKPKNFHITLAFLGEITSSQVSNIKEILENISSKHEPFTIELSNLGFFPNRKNPKVFWIGINEQLKLSMLKDDIDRSLTELNVNFDKKPFSPHLTIARFKSPQKIKFEALEALDFRDSFLVNEILLMKSDLFSDGPVYSKLYSFKLG